MWQTNLIVSKALHRRKSKRSRTLFLRLTYVHLPFTLRPIKKLLEAELTGGVKGGFDGVAMFVLLENCVDGQDSGERVDECVM